MSDNKQQYYVFNETDAHRGWMDGCIVWWRAEGKGYTYNLDDAGLFTDEDRLVKNYPSERHGCVYVPKEIVDAHCSSPRLAWWSAGYKDPIKPVLDQYRMREKASSEAVA